MSPHVSALPVLRVLAALLILCPGILRADKVFLKSGDIVTGSILEETDDIVRIEVTAGTIKDKRSIPKVSIDRIERTTQEDVDYEACLPLRTTPDGLPAKGYDDRLRVIGKFLTDYPASKYLAEIQGLRDALTSELEKVNAGQVRFRGSWLSPEQQAIHAPNLEASAVLRSMRQAAAARNYLAALRQFETLEKNHVGSFAYPEAVTEVRQILPAYGRKLTQELEYARYQAAENAKGLAALQESARIEAQRQIEAENARFKAQVTAEKAAKITWTSVDMRSEANLNEAIALVKKEMGRINKIVIEPFQEQAKALYAAGELIHAGKLDEADAALKAALTIKGGMRAPASSSAAAAAGTTVPAVLRQQLAAGIDKRKKAAELAARGDSDAVRAVAGSPAAKDPAATPSAGEDAVQPPSAEDALDALVVKRAVAPAATAAKSDVPVRSQPPERRSPVASGGSPVKKSGGNPLPFLIGVVAVGLVGVTVFLYLQEQKKNSGE